ncbi:MAG: HPr-rel-A system PqqD family peptide chaperone [Sphingobium sp.]
MTDLSLYRAEPPDALLVQPLDELTLLYHRPSGQTHMVMSPVPEILDALRAGAADAMTLHARLLRAFDLGPADEAIPVIAAHLEEMTRLGVVRRL